MILSKERLLLLALVGAEGAWLWGAFALLGHALAEGQLHVVWLWLLYPAGLMLRRALGMGRMSPRARRATGMVALGIATLLITWSQFYNSYFPLNPAWLGALGVSVLEISKSLPGELVVLLGGPLLGVWGWHLAEQRITFSSGVARFQFGTVMLLLVLGLSSLLKSPMPEAVPVTVAFFVFALGGMLLGRGEWGQGDRRPVWTALSLGSVAAVLVLGLLLITLLTPGILQLALAPLRWLGSVAMAALEALMEWWPTPEAMKQALLDMGQMEPASAEPEVRKEAFPPWLWEAFRSGWMILMVGALLLAFFRISSQIWEWLRGRFATPGAEVESLEMDLGLGLRGWLAALLALLLRGRWPRRRRDALAGDASSVRYLYRGLLRWGRRRGQPRSPAQTPLEYLEALGQLAPERHSDFEALTQAYLDARYSPTPPDPKALPELQSRWHKVRKTHRWRRRVQATA